MTNKILTPPQPQSKNGRRPYRPARRQPGSHSPRWRKILHIGQAHLAPGMSLKRWRQILDRHGVGDSWNGVSDGTIDKIVAEIGEIVSQARQEQVAR